MPQTRQQARANAPRRRDPQAPPGPSHLQARDTITVTKWHFLIGSTMVGLVALCLGGLLFSSSSPQRSEGGSQAVVAEKATLAPHMQATRKKTTRPEHYNEPCEVHIRWSESPGLQDTPARSFYEMLQVDTPSGGGGGGGDGASGAWKRDLKKAWQEHVAEGSTMCSAPCLRYADTGADGGGGDGGDDDGSGKKDLKICDRISPHAKTACERASLLVRAYLFLSDSASRRIYNKEFLPALQRSLDRIIREDKTRGLDVEAAWRAALADVCGGS